MNLASCSAPARVDLSGGVADIFGGCTVSVAISLRARCTVAPTPGKTGIILNGTWHDLHGEPLPGQALITAVARSCGAQDLTFSYTTDIPPSSGLGGSASLAVSAMAVIHHARGVRISPYDLAEQAQRVETTGMGLVNGYQDQYAAVFGSCLYLDFEGKANKPLGQEPYAVVERHVFPFPLVVAHTGTSHSAGDANAAVVSRYEAGDTTVRSSISRLNALTRALRTALIRSDYATICEVVNENQAHIRAFGRSYPENEALIGAALDAGADAAKVTGAGCGGSIAALCRTEDEAASVAAALAETSPFVRVCQSDRGVRPHD